MAKLYVCSSSKRGRACPRNPALEDGARRRGPGSASDATASLFTDAPQASTGPLFRSKFDSAPPRLVQPLIALVSCVRKTSYAALADARSWCGGVLERLSEYRGLQDGQFYAFCGWLADS